MITLEKLNALREEVDELKINKKSYSSIPQNIIYKEDEVGNLLGYLTYWGDGFYEDDKGNYVLIIEIDFIYVAKKYRKQGIGQSLYEEIADRFDRAEISGDCTKYSLEARETFCRRRGLSLEIGERETVDGQEFFRCSFVVGDDR